MKLILVLITSLILQTQNSFARESITIKIVGDVPTWEMLSYPVVNKKSSIYEALKQNEKYEMFKAERLSKGMVVDGMSAASIYGSSVGLTPALLGTTAFFLTYLTQCNENTDNRVYTVKELDGIKNCFFSNTSDRANEVEAVFLNLEQGLINPLSSELSAADPAFVAAYGNLDEVKLNHETGVIVGFSLDSGYVFTRKENGKTVWFEGKNVMNENLEVLHVSIQRSLR